MLEELVDELPVIWPSPLSEIVCEDHRVVEVREGPLSWPALLREDRYARRADARGRWVEGRQPEQDAVMRAAQTLLDDVQPIINEFGAPDWHTTLVLSAVDRLEELEQASFLWSIGCRLRPEQSEIVDLSGTVRDVSGSLLHVVSLPSVLWSFLRGETDWDRLILSTRARFERAPDTFDSFLHQLLRFGRDEGTRQALVDWHRQTDGNEHLTPLTIRRNGCAYTIPRHCPHEGEPLDLPRWRTAS